MQSTRSRYYKIPHQRWQRVGPTTIEMVEETYHPRGLVILSREQDSSVCNVGWAWCVKEDAFNKKVARKIALGRMVNKPIKIDLNDQASVVNKLDALPYHLKGIALWLIEGENRRNNG